MLPETFLKSESAGGIRRFLASSCWILCVVDLTAVKICEDVVSLHNPAHFPEANANEATLIAMVRSM